MKRPTERQRETARLYAQRYSKANPQKARDSNARVRAKRKAEVIEAGGGCCKCCGETDPDVLTLDHVEGGGRQELIIEKATFAGFTAWKDAHRNGLGAKYQILCANCNHSKHINGGTCVHQGGTRTNTPTAIRLLREANVRALGCRCVECGEREISILVIDHVQNNGHEERKLFGMSYKLQRHIRDSGPDTARYQCLCHNCNLRKLIHSRPNRPSVLPPPPQAVASFHLVSPKGELVEIVNSTKFCRENGLNNSNICLLRKGRIKSSMGWTLP